MHLDALETLICMHIFKTNIIDVQCYYFSDLIFSKYNGLNGCVPTQKQMLKA